MFDGKLKTSIKGGKVQGTLVVVGDSGPVLISVRERVIGRDVSGAVSRVVNQMIAATEFFPLKNLIGRESFAKAIRLYAVLKKGDEGQKRRVLEEMKMICRNSREKNDPTSQDIDYALSRFARAEREAKINISGDFIMDAFGFSPVNLRNNLNKLADTNPFFAKARELYQMLESGNPAKINEAKRFIRKLYVKLNSPVVAGNAQSGAHNILVGISQYYRAKKMSGVKRRMFGRDDVTMGVSFKKMKKGLKKAAKATGSFTKKTVKAATITALAPISLPILMIKKGPKEGAKSFLKATALTALGPAAVPVLATKKGRRALTDVRKAKSVSPTARAKAVAITNAAQRGDPKAQALLKKMNPAGKAVARITITSNAAKNGNKSAIKEMTNLKLAVKTNTAINKVKEDAKKGDPEAKTAVENLKAAEVPEDYLPEEMNEAVVDPNDVEEASVNDQETPGDEQYEEAYENPDDVVEEDLTETVTDVEDIVGFKFSLKPGKKMKAAMSFAKPLAKKLTPLAAAAANSFAPGSGAVIQAALPSLIDMVPSDRKKDLTMAKLSAGIDMVKAASEMDPTALANIDNIKKLAEQGVPKAVTALDALKIAKATQKVIETTTANAASAVLEDRKYGVKASPTKAKFASSDDGIVDVRIVEWGPRKS